MRDANKITAVQFMFSVACVIQASSLLTTFIYPVTGHDSWLTVILGMLVGFLPVAAFAGLMKLNPGMDLLDMLNFSFGRPIGIILGWLYLFFFMTVTALNLRFFVDYTKMSMMPNTPYFVIAACCIFLCVYSSHYGLNVVTRFSTSLVLLFSGFFLISLLLSGGSMQLDNFKPSMSLGLERYLQGTHIMSVIPHGETIFFLMLAPDIVAPKKPTAVYWVGAVLIGTANILVTIIRDTAVLGSTLTLFSLPSYETLRLVKISSGLGRLELLFVISQIVLTSFKITVMFYITVKTFSKLACRTDYRSYMLPMGVLLTIYSKIAYESSIQHSISARSFTPAIWTVFTVALPLLALAAGGIRRGAVRRRERVKA